MKEPSLDPAKAGRRAGDSPATRMEEIKAFLFLTVVTAPVLAVAVVGGYGFFVWMFQLATGRLPTG